MDYFKLLSFEVLEGIFCWLNPKDIISLSLTCRNLRSISLSDKLWTQVCFNESGLSLPSANGFSRRFYQNVLHPYGKYLGLWANKDEGEEKFEDCYGSFIQLSYADGQLIGVELHPPKIPHLMQPLRPKTLFTISMDESKEDKAIVKCCINPARPHLCELLSNGKNSLVIRCPESAACGREHDLEGVPLLLEQYVNDHWDLDVAVWDSPIIDFLDRKFMSLLRSSSYESHFYRIQYSSAPNFPVPIKPGIFKGTDGLSGIQFLMLSYEDENTVIGRKITGDEPVHAGQILFESDLHYSLHFGEGESQANEQLLEMELVASDVNWSERPKPQPFVLPQIYPLQPDETIPYFPNECLSRFQGAMVFNSSGDSAVRGHWIIFNENLFGFLAIQHFSNWYLYHRVQELQAADNQP